MTCLMKYSGCLRNPASVNTWFIPIIYRRATIPGGAGLRNHPQYVKLSFRPLSARVYVNLPEGKSCYPLVD
jgi:hypothetical protein